MKKNKGKWDFWNWLGLIVLIIFIIVGVYSIIKYGG
jgi:hypothetical protein